MQRQYNMASELIINTVVEIQYQHTNAKYSLTDTGVSMLVPELPYLYSRQWVYLGNIDIYIYFII